MLDGDWTTSSTSSNTWVLISYFRVDLLCIDGVVCIGSSMYWLLVFIIVNITTLAILNKEIRLSCITRWGNPAMDVFTVLLLITQGDCLLGVLSNFTLRNASELWSLFVVWLSIVNWYTSLRLDMSRHCILTLVYLLLLLHLNMLKLFMQVLCN